jgi:hypothetical protein
MARPLLDLPLRDAIALVAGGGAEGTFVEMKRTSLAALLLLPLLGACTSQGASSWVAPEPGVRDEAVAALLPQGAFTVSGGFYIGEELRTAIDGYVDFGVSVDGTDCVSDYTLTDERDIDDPSSSVRGVRNAAGPVWYREVMGSVAEDGTSELSFSGNSPWLDGSDPSAAPLPLLFVPALVAADFSPGISEGAGVGTLCSIPVMPRFMSVDADRLVFDPDRVTAASTAGRARWVQKFVDATGLQEPKRTEAIETLLEMSITTWETSITGTSITITESADGVVEITQTKDGTNGIVRLSFAPTQPRDVPAVVAKTFFDKVSEEIEANGLPPEDYVRDALGV